MGKKFRVGYGADDSLLHFNNGYEMSGISVRPDDIAIIQNGGDVSMIHGFKYEGWHK